MKKLKLKIKMNIKNIVVLKILNVINVWKGMIKISNMIVFVP